MLIPVSCVYYYYYFFFQNRHRELSDRFTLPLKSRHVSIVCNLFKSVNTTQIDTQIHGYFASFNTQTRREGKRSVCVYVEQRCKYFVFLLRCAEILDTANILIQNKVKRNGMRICFRTFFFWERWPWHCLNIMFNGIFAFYRLKNGGSLNFLGGVSTIV